MVKSYFLPTQVIYVFIIKLNNFEFHPNNFPYG